MLPLIFPRTGPPLPADLCLLVLKRPNPTPSIPQLASVFEVLPPSFMGKQRGLGTTQASAPGRQQGPRAGPAPSGPPAPAVPTTSRGQASVPQATGSPLVSGSRERRPLTSTSKAGAKGSSSTWGCHCVWGCHCITLSASDHVCLFYYLIKAPTAGEAVCPQPEQSPKRSKPGTRTRGHGVPASRGPRRHGGHGWGRPGVRHGGHDEHHGASATECRSAIEGNKVLTLATRRVTPRGRPRARREDGLSQGPACEACPGQAEP